MQALISVIIPAYNRAHTLERCLNSVLAQSHPVHEIILIDDGSTDNTQELMHSHYPQVQYHYQYNQGVSNARNTGVRMATGEWIALLDSDDEWLPKKLEKQMSLLNENSDIRLCHCEEIWVRNGVRVNAMNKHRKSGGNIFERCLPLCVISPSAAIIHRSVFDEIGYFDESLPVCEDYDFWLRYCALHPVLFEEIPLLVKYGGHEDQLSRKLWGMDRYRVAALSKIVHSGVLNDSQKQQVVAELVSKCDILIKGGKKHNNQELVLEYTKIRQDVMDNVSG